MADDSLAQEALERAKKVGISPDLMAQAMRAERKDRPYAVELENRVAGSFFRVTQEGPTRVLYINTDHPFFVDCYMAPGTTQRYRDGIEVMLWTLGLGELEADEGSKARYVQERNEWSKRLSYALPILAELMDFDAHRQAQWAEENDEWDGDDS